MNTETTSFWEKVIHFFEQSAHHRLARELQFMSDAELHAVGMSRDDLNSGKLIWPVSTRDSDSIDSTGHGEIIASSKPQIQHAA